MASSGQEIPYKPGQLVWAKMKGYPFWPGKVLDESEVPDASTTRKSKKFKTVCVKFFGTGDFAFMPLPDVKLYFQFRNKYIRASKRRDFLTAVEAAEHYVTMNDEVRNFETGFVEDSDQLISNDDDDDRLSKEEGGGAKSTTGEKIGDLADNDGSASSSSSKSHPSMTTSTPSSAPAPVPAPAPIPAIPIARGGIKRAASPSNGPQAGRGVTNIMANAVAPKRYASSAPSARVSNEYRDKKIGFIGLGTIGSRLARRLITRGFRVTLYDRSLQDKLNKGLLQELSQVPKATSPAHLMQECDIVFNCVYDSDAAREVVFGTNGVVDTIGAGKSYVELTTIDPQTAIEAFEIIKNHGGRFLEAPVSGLKKDAEEGRLVFLCAGDKSLFDECGACFEAIGRRAVFFGEAGNGAKFRLLHQMLAGVMTAGVAEVAAVAYRCGLSIDDLNDVIGDYSPMGCSLVKQIFKDILQGVFEPSQQLGQMQKEMQLGLTFIGYDMAQPTFVASAANQAFLHARRAGEEISDSAAIYRILSDSAHTTNEASTSATVLQQQSGGDEQKY